MTLNHVVCDLNGNCMWLKWQIMLRIDACNTLVIFHVTFFICLSHINKVHVHILKCQFKHEKTKSCVIKAMSLLSLWFGFSYI